MDEKYVLTICKMGQGKECCRYLTMGSRGWSCEKLTNLKSYFDKRVTENTITAQGDNCAGKPTQ